MTASVPNLNTEELRMYAKMLRLSNLRANCADIIHRVVKTEQTVTAKTAMLLQF